STATTTIVTPTTPKTGIVSGNGSYVSPLDQKTYTCNADSKPFNSFMRLNSKNNDVNQVKLWQAFLNADLGLNIPITGFFGQQTFEATKAFQKKYASEILTPWDIQDATGYFYKSTQYKANNLLSCSGMTLTLDNGVVLNY
ncbi:MAG: peptidoglycan-binding domain-containing protein, partial [Candidatus Pacebacteria bacterium]|nr:peptidoglycan-binding domain-containing protein [Candidatus Paceibacterota bacterium]